MVDVGAHGEQDVLLRLVGAKLGAKLGVKLGAKLRVKLGVKLRVKLGVKLRVKLGLGSYEYRSLGRLDDSLGCDQGATGCN